jgi:RNA polymerase sigma-70 factor (ECF subfamily)
MPSPPDRELLRAFDVGLDGRGDASAVATALGDAIATARRAWPDLPFDDKQFARELGAVIEGPDVAGELKGVHVADLFLARACVAGVSEAQRAFDSQHLTRVAEWIAHVDRSPAFAADVRQDASRLLLMADGESPPKLNSYSGRGALGAFARVFVTRLARRFKRRKAEAPYVDPDEQVLKAPDLDPEVRLLRSRFAREFAEAFKATLAELDADERNVLRLHYLDGLSIDEVGTTYRVSRATAARWLAKARARVVEETQRRLAARMGASAPNAASLLSMVQSQLDVSLRRFFV